MPNWLLALVRDEIAKKVFWLILAAVGAAVLIFVKEAQHEMHLLTVLLSVTLTLVVCIFILIEVARRKSYRLAWYPHVKFHFEVISKKIVYKIDERGSLHYSRRLIVRATQDNLDGYTDRFVWTGGMCGTPTGGVGISSVEARLVAGIWTFFHVNFDRTLRRGEQHEFEIIWPVLQNWKNSSPFVSASTDEPTRSLAFEVTIPQSELSSPTALLEELRGIEAIYPFRTQKLQFDNDRLLVSPHPKLYRHYRIRWSWEGAATVRQIPDIAAIPSEQAELTS